MDSDSAEQSHTTSEEQLIKVRKYMAGIEILHHDLKQMASTIHLICSPDDEVRIMNCIERSQPDMDNIDEILDIRDKKSASMTAEQKAQLTEMTDRLDQLFRDIDIFAILLQTAVDANEANQ